MMSYGVGDSSTYSIWLSIIIVRLSNHTLAFFLSPLIGHFIHEHTNYVP